MISPRKKRPKEVYSTRGGTTYCSLVEDFLCSPIAKKYRGKIQLLFTSPPFPLNRKKKYGNLRGPAYLEWLATFAPVFREMLAPNGSIVIELGNAWEPGRPVMSTLALEALLAFKAKGKLKLVQQFVAHNPARLPSPAQWVNVERIRVKDTFTHLWWLARSDRPYADNRSILTEYSDSMKSLLRSKKYNSGKRPSGHRIGKRSFLRNNGGAIPSNVLPFSNTSSTDGYLEYCRKKGLKPHPARMQNGIAEFFIKFLTRKGDIVFDPFAGSNTTGATAEALGRKWVSVEANPDYIKSSRGRFVKCEGRNQPRTHRL
jgi:DNA modification methylase